VRTLGQRLGVFGMDIAAIVAIVAVQLEDFGGELIVAVVVGGTRHLCGAGNGHGDRDTSRVFDSNAAARTSSFLKRPVSMWRFSLLRYTGGVVFLMRLLTRRRVFQSFRRRGSSSRLYG